MNNKLTLLLLSCDAYSDLWDDFFSIKEKYWPDCPFDWILVTESKGFKREGVSVLDCGKDLNWAGRLRKAVNSVKTPYVGIFLEDYFITDKIDNGIIESNISLMESDNVTLVNMSDVFHTILDNKTLEYYAPHLIHIPNNLLYGISTASSIWDRQYLLDKLGEGDYSAWQFEIDRYNEAKSEKGFGGLLLCDDRMPFHVSEIPVVTQGMYTPAAIRFFRKKGIIVNSGHRKVMSEWEYFVFALKLRLSKVKTGKRLLRWVGKTFFHQKYFMD